MDLLHSYTVIYGCKLFFFSSFGVMLWFPTYIGEITTQQKQAAVDANCRQNLTHFSAELLQSYCSCKNATFQDALITGAQLDSWMISDAIFSNVTFRDVTFDDVVFNGSVFVNNCAFINCTIKNSQLLRITLSNLLEVSLDVSSSVLCDLHGLNENDTLTVKNTSLDGNVFGQTTIINGLIFNDNSSKCINQVTDSGISCSQSDISTVYRDSFFISASTLPGYIVSAIAVYLFRRNYWLGEHIASSSGIPFPPPPPFVSNYPRCGPCLQASFWTFSMYTACNTKKS